MLQRLLVCLVLTAGCSPTAAHGPQCGQQLPRYVTQRIGVCALELLCVCLDKFCFYAYRPWSSSYVSAEAGLLNHCCWQQWSILSVPQHLGVVNFFLVAAVLVACVVL